MSIAATDDITETATIVGVENVNLNFDAAVSATETTSASTFYVDAINISGTNLTTDIVADVTTVTAVEIANIATETTVNTNAAILLLTTVDAASDTTINMTSTDATTITNVDGITDNLTITSAGDVTIADSEAEEVVTVTSAGKVTINALTPANVIATAALSVTAADDVAITDHALTGTMDVTTTEGNVVIGAGGVIASDDKVTLNTDNGDVTVTQANATDELVITATGDGDAAVTGADGDVLVTKAALATDITITASNDVQVDEVASAENVTITAGGAVDLGVTGGPDVDSITDLTLSVGADSTVDATATGLENLSIASTLTVDAQNDAAVVTLQAGAGVALEAVTVTGTNDVSLSMASADIDDAEEAFATFAMTDSSTGTTKLVVSTEVVEAIDLSAVAFDEIEITTNQAGNVALTVASAATLTYSVDQTVTTITSAADAGNSVNLVVADDAAGVDTGVVFTAIGVTDINTVNVSLAEDSEITAINVEATNDLVITGTGALVLGGGAAKDVVANEVDASALEGVVTFTGDEDSAATEYKFGTADDDINLVATAAVSSWTIDGGAGVDTITVTGDAFDFSDATLNLTSIEKIDVTAGNTTFDNTQISGKSYLFISDGDDDVVEGEGAGATIDMSGIMADGDTALKVTGSNGGDIITGSSTKAAAINAGTGDDNITSGAAVATINGEAGSDEITLSGANNIVILDQTAGLDTITGFATGDTLKNTDIGTSTNTAEITETAAFATRTLDDNDTIVLEFNASTTSALASTGTLTITDFTDVSNGGDVMAYLDEVFSVVDADEAAIVLNDGTNSYTYYYLNDGNDDFDAGDTLVLVGQVNDHVLVAADVAIA